MQPEFSTTEEFEAWVPQAAGNFVAVDLAQPTCRPDRQWEEFATPESFERMRQERDAARRRWTAWRGTGPGSFTTGALRRRLEDAGALGVLHSNWSNDYGVNKVFGTALRRIPTLDLSCEDYGLLARATTDAAGRASIFLTLGNRAGSGSDQVIATAVGFASEVEFRASATAGAPNRILSIPFVEWHRKPHLVRPLLDLTRNDMADDAAENVLRATASVLDLGRHRRNQFRNPVHSIEVSADGLVYVADRNSSRVQVFQREGTFVQEGFVAPNTRPGSAWAIALSSDPEQRYLYLADGANYKAMQFAGSVVKRLTMEERLTLTNMTTEAGAKNGIIEPDETTNAYLRERTDAKYSPVNGDQDAEYAEVFTYEIEKLEPTVAKPFSPGNISVARELQGTEIDKAYIGSCTGAKLEDLREAARILKGKKVKIIPIQPLKKPEWIRVRSPSSRTFYEVKQILRSHQLHTVCEEASCPNIGECFGKGTATFMILGDLCTRRCPFCDVAHGRPRPPDANEPANLARTIAALKLKYVVITSVDRDDLRDGGARHSHHPGVHQLRQQRPARCHGLCAVRAGRVGNGGRGQSVQRIRRRRAGRGTFGSISSKM